MFGVEVIAITRPEIGNTGSNFHVANWPISNLITLGTIVINISMRAS